MFQNQKEEKPTSQQNLNQNKDLKIEDIPIHTMKKDLEEIEHPSPKKNVFSEDTPRPQMINLNEKQKTSPFLSSAPVEQKVEPQKMPEPAVEQQKSHSFFSSLLGSKSAEEKAEEKIAEKRILAQQAEEDRLSAQRAETEKIVAKQKEEEKILMEKKAAIEKKMAEQKAAEQRILEAQRAAEIQKAEAQKLAEEKIAQQKAEENRLMEQKSAAEKRMDEQRIEAKGLIEMQRAAEQQKHATEAEQVKISGNGQKTSAALNKSIAATVLILIIIILGAGIYYYASTRQNADIAITEPTPVVEPTVEDPIVVPEEPAKTELSAVNPNYLNIDDLTTSAGGETKDLIGIYANKVLESGIMTPVEFIVVDEKNNPIPFSLFAKKLRMQLSAGILSGLNENFSLFIYNDEGSLGTGLSIQTKNSPALKTTMLKSEKDLVSQISPLFLTADFKIPSTPFGKSLYKNTEIHFINMISGSSPALSLDYTITDNRLLIGTSKMTLRSIIDKLSATNSDAAAKTSAN